MNSATELSDEQLMSIYKDTGDKQVFHVLHDRHHGEVVRFLGDYLNRRGFSAVSPDDAAQETFIAVFRFRDQYNVEKPFRPWLYSIAINTATDLVRKQYRLRTPTARPDVSLTVLVDGISFQPDAGCLRPDESVGLSETLSRLRALVQQLPDGERDAVTATFFNGRSHAEAAAELGIPTGTVKSRLDRAFGRLRGQMQQAMAVA